MIVVPAGGGGAAVTVTGVSPSTGVVGDTLTLTGTGFAVGQAVLCGGVTMGSINVVSATSITATIPAGVSYDSAINVSVAGVTRENAVTVYRTSDIVNNASFETGWDGFTDNGGGDPIPRDIYTTIGRDNTQAYADTYSVKYTWAANTADAAAAFWFVPASLSVDEVWIRFYFRIASGSALPPIQKFFLFRPGGSGTFGGVMLNNGVGLGFDNNGPTASIVPDASITRDAWHSFEVHFRKNGDAQPNAAFWFDGAQVTKADGPDPVSSSITWVGGRMYMQLFDSLKIGGFSMVGTRNGPQAASGTLWFDRVAISSLGRIGP
jgi:hypothetical protein